MPNRALQDNGFTNTVTTDNHITTRGSDWYFTVTSVFGALTLAIWALSFTKPRSQRLFHYMTGAAALVSSIAYFAEGSNLGWTAIEVEFPRSDPKVAGVMRQIFYVRYIDYFVTTPLLLAELLLTAGLPTPTIWYTVLINEVFVVTRLVGALVKSTYKWGFFTFGVFAFFFVAYTVLYEGRAYARPLGADVFRLYSILAIWSVAVGVVYPIVWAVSEGGNVIPADSEAVAYGVLDLASKVVFAVVLLGGLRNVDIAARLGIHIRDAAPLSAPALAEKKAEAEAEAGVAAAPPAPAAEPETV